MFKYKERRDFFFSIAGDDILKQEKNKTHLILSILSSVL